MNSFTPVQDEHGSYYLGGRLANSLIRHLNTAPAAVQGKKSPEYHNPHLVGVINTASAAREAGRVMGIKRLAVEASALDATASDPKNWYSLPRIYEVEDYAAATHGSRLVVLLEPLPESDDIVGVAATGGTVKLKINITAATHKFATLPAAADGTKLESAATGEFEIISQPKNTDNTAKTGEQYCTVRFPVELDGIDAINTSGYAIEKGFLLEPNGINSTTGILNIKRPTADNLAHSFVALSPAATGHALKATRAFEHPVYIQYSGTAPQPGKTIGTVKDSFLGKSGNEGYVVHAAEFDSTLPGSGVRGGFFRSKLGFLLLNGAVTNAAYDRLSQKIFQLASFMNDSRYTWSFASAEGLSIISNIDRLGYTGFSSKTLESSETNCISLGESTYVLVQGISISNPNDKAYAFCLLNGADLVDKKVFYINANNHPAMTGFRHLFYREGNAHVIYYKTGYRVHDYSTYDQYQWHMLSFDGEVITDEIILPYNYNLYTLMYGIFGDNEYFEPTTFYVNNPSGSYMDVPNCRESIITKDGIYFCTPNGSAASAIVYKPFDGKPSNVHISMIMPYLPSMISMSDYCNICVGFIDFYKTPLFYFDAKPAWRVPLASGVVDVNGNRQYLDELSGNIFTTGGLMRYYRDLQFIQDGDSTYSLYFRNAVNEAIKISATINEETLYIYQKENAFYGWSIINSGESYLLFSYGYVNSSEYGELPIFFFADISSGEILACGMVSDESSQDKIGQISGNLTCGIVPLQTKFTHIYMGNQISPIPEIS